MRLANKLPSGLQSNRTSLQQTHPTPQHHPHHCHRFLERFIKWPAFDLDLSQTILNAFLLILAQHSSHQNSGTKTTSSSSLSNPNPTSKINQLAEKSSDRTTKNHSSAILENFSPAKHNAFTLQLAHNQIEIHHSKQDRGCRQARSEILRHLVMGINSVVKRLEAQMSYASLALFRIRDTSEASLTHPSKTHLNQPISIPIQHSPSSYPTDSAKKPITSPNPTIALVLVCRQDISPPGLVAHIPTVLSNVNDAISNMNARVDQSAEMLSTIPLIELPVGAEHVLAQKLGVRRAAAIGLLNTTPGLENILDLIVNWSSSSQKLPMISDHSN